MQLTTFRADAHAAGQRIDLSWEIHPERGERLDGSLPPVRIRRKQRDFEYPAVPEGNADPFLIYDEATFSADTTLPAHYEIEAGYRITEEVDADEVADADEPQRRRWIRTYRTSEGVIDHLAVRLADREGLKPGTVYYYQVSGTIVPEGGNPAPYRAVAQATGDYQMDAQLYTLLPSLHQRYDEMGQLRAFVSIFGDQLDLWRSTAEYLTALHDVDSVDYRALPLLAAWLGWDLNFAAPIPIHRHEIKYAAALYRITGTIPGCKIWVKRLTGWDAEIKEFYRNVFFANDLGNPDLPPDRGSRTVDTSDVVLMANIGTARDELDYTYDTGMTNDDWYAYKVVGIFVRPNEADTVALVKRKLANLMNNRELFLPVNMRGVVILDLDTVTSVGTDTLDLLSGSEDETG
jgi:phage tail-like protein